MSEWQPIETAPKDGSRIAVWDCGYVPWVKWVGGGWVSELIRWGGRPTHWQPLPAPPEDVTQHAGEPPEGGLALRPGAEQTQDTDLCEDCPPIGYPTDKTRCLPCPRRSNLKEQP